MRIKNVPRMKLIYEVREVYEEQNSWEFKCLYVMHCNFSFSEMILNQIDDDDDDDDDYTRSAQWWRMVGKPRISRIFKI